MPRRCESLSFYLIPKPPTQNIQNLYDNATMEFDDEYFPFLKNLSASYLLVHGYICVFLCIFGILTNVLNFVILRRREMRTSVNVVLSQIAVCDLATMISYLVFVNYFYIWSRDPECSYRGYSKNWMNFILFHSSWSVLMHTTSIWLAVLLALVRLAVMKHSNLGKKMFQLAVCQKWIVWVLLLVILLGFPVSLTNQVTKLGNAPTCDPKNASENISAKEFEYQVQNYYTVNVSSIALEHDCALLRFTLWTNGICFKLGPCIVLMISIFGLLKTVNQAKKRRLRLSTDYCNNNVDRASSLRRRSASTGCSRRSGSSRSRSAPVATLNCTPAAARKKQFGRRTTKMLVAILSIFVVTELPQAVLTTASGLFTHDLHFHVYPLVGDMLDLLSLLNSCVNFVLYCAMSSRYRMAFERTMRPVKIYLRSKILNDNVAAVLQTRCGHSPTGGRSIASFFPDNVSVADGTSSMRSGSMSRKHNRLTDYQETQTKNTLSAQTLLRMFLLYVTIKNFLWR